jgi:hypothetical protein
MQLARHSTREDAAYPHINSVDAIMRKADAYDAMMTVCPFSLSVPAVPFTACLEMIEVAATKKNGRPRRKYPATPPQVRNRPLRSAVPKMKIGEIEIEIIEQAS